jgi:hypothetical protein
MSATVVEARANGHDEEQADLATIATMLSVVSAMNRSPDESSATPFGASSFAVLAGWATPEEL